MYYLDKQGDVSRSQMARAGKGGGNAEKEGKVTRESGIYTLLIKMGMWLVLQWLEGESSTKFLFLKKVLFLRTFFLFTITKIID